MLIPCVFGSLQKILAFELQKSSLQYMITVSTVRHLSFVFCPPKWVWIHPFCLKILDILKYYFKKGKKRLKPEKMWSLWTKYSVNKIVTILVSAFSTADEN